MQIHAILCTGSARAGQSCLHRPPDPARCMGAVSEVDDLSTDVEDVARSAASIFLFGLAIWITLNIFVPPN